MTGRSWLLRVRSVNKNSLPDKTFFMPKYIPLKIKLIHLFLLWVFIISFSFRGICQVPSNTCSTALPQKFFVNSAPCSNFTLVQPYDISTALTPPPISACNGVTSTGRDGWGWFTATTTISNVQYTNKNTDAMIFIYNTVGGVCPSNALMASNLIACADDWIINNPETVTFNTVVGTNYLIRIVSKSGSLAMLGSICVWGTTLPPPCTPVPVNDDPCNAITIPVNSSCVYTTYTNACSTPTNFIPPPTCGNYVGNDVWFKAIVPASGQITFDSNTGVMTDGAMAVYDTTGGGACGSGLNLIACDDDNSANGLMPRASAAGLTPGSAVWVRFWSNGGLNNGTFKICATDPSPCASAPANDDPCGAILVPVTIPCNLVFYTNLCATNSTSLPNIPDPSCGSYAGSDVWFKCVVPASGTLSIRLNTGVMTDGSLALYTGASCSGPLTEVDCDDDSGPGLMPALVTQGLIAGSTVYIRVWSFNNSKNGTFRMCLQDPCPSGTPVNDLPCNATMLPYGINFPSSNGCATNTSDPATMPACFINTLGTSQMNTVWFKFTATSTCTKIKTFPGTMVNTQMAVYGGTCSALGAALDCNDDYLPCTGGYTYRYSQIQLNTVVGNSYYIMVDGRNGRTGSFSIEIIDGGTWPACANDFPAITGQECSLPIPVCKYTTDVPNPGFLTIGNICDFSAPSPSCVYGSSGCSSCTSECMCTGERGSAWYKVTIGTVVTPPQYLEFSIVPNNYPGFFPGDETDYDFAVFGPNPNCSSLTTPIRCNYNPLGVTGVYGPSAGQASPAYSPTFDGAFRERIPVNTGEVYYINISNFENTKVGFSLIIEPTTPIANVVPPGSTLIWTGAVSTDWFDVNNWGGCMLPYCSVNAIIPSFPTNQPIINAAGANCRNIDINVDATLTINTGFELNVCGDFLNNGSFVANTGSTVLFQDTSSSLSILHQQAINGNVTGVNKFMNVTVKKPAPWGVVTSQNIDMGGDFLVSGGAGYGGNFTATNKYHKVTGNFTVESAPLVATYTPATILEFNGTVQTYLNRGLLDSVLINQTGAGTLTLQNHGLVGAAWMGLANTGVLTLTNGIIKAGFSHSATDNRVELNNRTVTAVNAGGLASYIEGALRRYMPNGGTGSYNFPVGSLARGYELLNINITTALPAVMNYWDVYFDQNTTPASPTFATECSSDYHNGLTALNHGLWTMQSSPSPLLSGVVNVTNFNRSYTNTTGSGWTVQSNNQINNGVANWFLNPFPQNPCVAPPIAQVTRYNMNLNTLFNSANEVWFATAQSATVLPVELLGFSAKAAPRSIKLDWQTASEKNNKGFDVERTTAPPYAFIKIGWVEGHGSTTTAHSYNFEDFDVKEGIEYYYRLRQVDWNKDFKYSDIVSARLNQSHFNLNIVPNPYYSFTNIIYTLDEQSRVKLEVYNSLGQKVTTLINTLQEAGMYNYDFSAKALGYSKGIYSVVIQVNDQVFSKRIMETE